MPDLTFQDVLNILRLIDSGPFSDFQVEFGDTKVKVTRETGTARVGARLRSETIHAIAPSTEPTRATPPARVPGVERHLDHPPALASVPSARLTVAATNQVNVKPPMAGTFYCAPSPGAAPFVEVDRAVRKGDKLGIVEVMKLFTPVLSPCDGTIRAILVRNEELVQSDQTLMIIEPAA